MRSEVQIHNGTPTLVLDGKPVALVSMLCRPQRWKRFREIGVQSIIAGTGEVWRGPDDYDLAAFDKAMDEVAREVGTETPVLLATACDAPSWWIAKHPDELHRTHDGRTFKQSLASRVWLDDVRKLQSAIARHSLAKYPQIFGYFPHGGHTGEWFYRTGPVRYLLDTSEPMRAGFGRWLREKYKDESALRGRWRDDSASFDTVAVPTRREELHTHVLSFRDPRKGSLRLADFYEYYAWVMAEAVRSACLGCKEGSDWSQVCGANYGHVLDWYGNPQTGQHVGHLALGHILSCREVDYLSGPNSYQDRSLGGDEYFIAPIDAFKLRGKMWFTQNDTRTHLSDHNQKIFGQMFTPASGASAVKRAAARCLATGTHYFWHDLMGGWYDSPELQALIERTSHLAREALARGRGSVAEVALVVDENSVFHQGLSDAFLADPIVANEPRLVDAVQHMGAPFDVFLQQDLLDPRTHHYKLYLFVNAYRVPPEVRRVVREKLQVKGKTLAWFYAPGYVDDEAGLSTRTMRDLTGITLKLDKIASELLIHVDNDKHEISQGLGGFGTSFLGWVFADFARHFGTHRPIGPLFHVEDAKAEALGYYTSTLRKALAVKKVRGSQAIFCGCPFMPPALLRRVCRFAGVHVYLDSDDAFWCNRGYIGFHAAGPGPRKLMLPGARRVREAFEDQALGEISEIAVASEPGSTHLFRMD